MQRVTKVGTSHWSHLHCAIERIADADRLGCLNKQMLKSVSDLFQQDETFGSQTHLPRVMKTRSDTSVNSLWNVRIFTDDESIRSAQLHHGLLDDFPCLGGHGGARPHAPRYGSAPNTRVINDMDDIVSFEDQVLKDTFWKTGFKHDPLELKRTPLGVQRVFHENDIAGQYRWDGHARQLPSRKVPRHDRENGSQGQI